MSALPQLPHVSPGCLLANLASACMASGYGRPVSTSFLSDAGQLGTEVRDGVLGLHENLKGVGHDTVRRDPSRPNFDDLAVVAGWSFIFVQAGIFRGR